jgi:hypothetical protein
VIRVKIDKSVVSAALRERGHHDRAQEADCLLPRSVDTDRDAGLIHKFDVNLVDLIGQGPSQT